MKFFKACSFLFSAFVISNLFSAEKASYDESKIEPYTLPNVFAVPSTGEIVNTPYDWANKVRPELIEIFQKEFYSNLPPRPNTQSFELLESSDDALGGIALRRQYRITVKSDGGEHSFDILLYLPKNVKYPVPAILGYNFCGNHTINADPAIFVTKKWVPERGGGKVIAKGNVANEEARGAMSFRWNVEDIIKNGYAFAGVYYGDIYPDYPKKDGSPDSIYNIFTGESGFRNGTAIVAWAWGGMRVMDLLETLPEIDKSKVAVIGHSRLGKTALLTGVLDCRFAAAISNNSGCMGAALSHRRIGETIDIISEAFPLWFSSEIKKYAKKETTMPYDQHQLIACMAPRAVYVASAADDAWADPKGEFLGLYEASKIYALYGAKNLPKESDYGLNKNFLGDNMGYHLRDGKHNLLPEDWKFYFEFFKKVFSK